MPSTNLPAQIKTVWKNLSFGKRLSLLTLVAGTIIGFIYIIMMAGKPDLQPLYSNLTLEDAGAISAKLKDDKIPYEISSNGSSILVPRRRVYEVRMELASQGLPKGGGVGFEIFDNTSLGMTEFVQSVNYQRALQGELSRTINGFEEVESSRVHLVIPSKSLFIEDEDPPRASVVLKLRPGKWLNKDQVQGIVHLVASSVSRLNPETVTVVDSNGKMLAGFKENSTIGKVSSEQLQYKENLERRLENRIKTMLETVLGPGKAIVRISCSLNFKRQEKTEERYGPKNIIRSEKLITKTSNEQGRIPEGIPGVASNVKLGIRKSANNAVSAGSEYQTNMKDRTVNYEIAKITSHTVEPIGIIEKISVAAIVDGTYNFVKEKGSEGKWKFIPRTQEEMDKLENIVKSSVNFQSDRGDVVEVANMPFETTKSKLSEGNKKPIEEGWLYTVKNYIPSSKYILPVILVMLLLLFVVRPLVRWITATSAGYMDIPNQLPMTVEEIERENGAGMNNLHFRDLALDMIAKDRASSVKSIRDWVKEPNETNETQENL